MLLTTLSLLLFSGGTDVYAGVTTNVYAGVSTDVYPGVTCKYPTSPREAFSAALYTALVLTSDQTYVYSLKVSGLEAASLEYEVVYRVLTEFGIDNAGGKALNGSLIIAMTETLSVTEYLEKSAEELGIFLNQNGLLDCFNAVPRVLESFGYFERVLKGLDGSKFESYLTAVLTGLLEYSLALGFELEDALKQMSDIFYQLFAKEGYSG